MLWWLSVAPLGKPVVPEVYWMLIGSSMVSSAPSSANRTGSGVVLVTCCHWSSPRMSTCSSPGHSPRTSSIMAT
ncbi:Uncharacterised protein [Mycobacteroides abscessus subsp. abscessus]|nr:Uncharacterised protein [Mycobacteroides abscessus subsp. abscessus]